MYAAFGRLACKEDFGAESENIARAAWKHDHAADHAELGAGKEESGVESERIARAAWTDDHAVYVAELCHTGKVASNIVQPVFLTGVALVCVCKPSAPLQLQREAPSVLRP